MQHRRDFMQLALAGALVGVSGAEVRAQDRFDQQSLLDFYTNGTITLLHFSDLKGQLNPLFVRPADAHAGQDKVPYLTGEAFRIRYGIGGRSPLDYAYTHQHFTQHARDYGRLGGVAHLGGAVQAIRVRRPEAVLLDGGDDFEPLFTPTGQMRPVHEAFLTDARFEDAASEIALYDRAGATFAVIVLRASPDPVAKLQKLVADARSVDAAAVIVLSRAGFAADRVLAEQTEGVDVIFSGGGHHVTPEPEVINGTQIIASGGQGCFLTRLDLWIEEGKVTASLHRLIPVFSDLIRPDPALSEMGAGDGDKIGRAAALLYRRDVVASPWDDVIGHALRAEYDAQITLTPGFRWGASVLSGREITQDTLCSVTQGPPAATQSRQMRGSVIKQLLEDAAEDTFSAEPFRRIERDMMRAGGLGFTLTVDAARGARITDLVLLEDGSALQPDALYKVALWALDGDAGTGAPIKDVLTRYIKQQGLVGKTPSSRVKLVR